MAAPEGNQFWLKRSSHGRNPIFPDAETLWNAACEYFQWAEDNPLEEEKVFHAAGQVTHAKVSKMRAMTQAGLCLFLDIGTSTYADYASRDGFSEVTGTIDNVIRGQKFAGAAADLLNANIIARDLGLTDKNQQTIGVDGDLGHVIKALTDTERVARLLGILDRGENPRD